MTGDDVSWHFVCLQKACTFCLPPPLPYLYHLLLPAYPGFFYTCRLSPARTSPPPQFYLLPCHGHACHAHAYFKDARLCMRVAARARREACCAAGSILASPSHGQTYLWDLPTAAAVTRLRGTLLWHVAMARQTCAWQPALHHPAAFLCPSSPWQLFGINMGLRLLHYPTTFPLPSATTLPRQTWATFPGTACPLAPFSLSYTTSLGRQAFQAATPKITSCMLAWHACLTVSQHTDMGMATCGLTLT